jgi:hypothetical protein
MQVSPHALRCQHAGWAAAGGEGRLELQGVTPQDVDAALHSNTRWLEDCSIRLLCVLALDRFGDFTSDQVHRVAVAVLVESSRLVATHILAMATKLRQHCLVARCICRGRCNIETLANQATACSFTCKHSSMSSRCGQFYAAM